MFSDNRTYLACVIAVLAAAAAMAVLFRCAGRLGLIDRPGGRKQHTGDIPLIGGLSALVGLLASALWYDGLGHFDRMLLATAAGLVAIGAIDDRRSLGVRVRVAIQAIVILSLIYSTGVYVHQLGSLFGHEIQLGWFGIPFTVVAVVGLLNAFNLIDGIDGLATLLAMVAIAGVLLTLGHIPRHGTDALLILLAFALLPALVCNLGWMGAQRKCFLGDAGSTLLGYVIGWALIFNSQQPASELSPVGTLWCVALPVLDTLAVMYRRIRAGVSPFKPGRGHIHYLLVGAGFGQRMTLAIISVAAVAMWALGAGVRMLPFGAGSNLAAFCLLIVAYIYATGRLEAWVNARSPVAIKTAPISQPAPAPSQLARITGEQLAVAEEHERRSR